MSGHRQWGEDCGVVAVYRRGAPAAELVHRGLFSLQHRGQEAAGISCTGPSDEIHHLKGVGLVDVSLPVFQVKKLHGEKAIGHVRYSTVTVDRSENIQPFIAGTPYGRLAIAHNGNLKNTDALHGELEAQGSLMSTTMDTELLVHLLARSGAKSFPEALRHAAEKAVGAYSLTLLVGGHVYAFRDAHGIRPLVLGQMPDGYAAASETCALEAMGATVVREVAPGELVELTESGFVSTQLLAPARPAPCVFELVYFARPDSVVFSQGVHGARTRMGEQLAKEDALGGVADKPDVVVPIPDSGFPAAVGYARVSGIPLEKAIIRSHYVGRTFILPDQDSRTHSLHLKLSVIREAVCGKRVVLIDDSIVRGNTSRLIVQMVRDNGATQVWMRIASPPLAWPCYLGIDTPDKSELAINRAGGDVAGVQRIIGADNLRYLSIGGLKEATRMQSFCYACMDGRYPV